MSITGKRAHPGDDKGWKNTASSSSSTAMVVSKPKPSIRRYNLNDLLQASIPKNIDDKAAIIERAEDVFVAELKKQLQDYKTDTPIIIDASFLKIKHMTTFNVITEFIEQTCVIQAYFLHFDFKAFETPTPAKLFDAIAKSRTLNKLTIAHANISEFQLLCLFNSLITHRNNPSMNHFEFGLSGLKFDSDLLLTRLGSIPTLQYLNLSLTKIKLSALEKLMTTINSNSSLLHLDLSDVLIWYPYELFNYIKAFLSGGNCTGLAANAITHLFTHFLKTNTTLVSLSLKKMKIASTVLSEPHTFIDMQKSLYSALAENPISSLEILNISNSKELGVFNSVTHTKLRELEFSPPLCDPTSLHHRKNFLDFMCFTNALSKSKWLQHLTLSLSRYNHTLGCEPEFKNALFENPTITTLELHNNDRCRDYENVLNKIIRGFHFNKSIHTLILRHIPINDSFVNTLIQILEKRNNTLCKIMIDWSQLRKPTAARLKAALKKNEKKLKTVQCGSVYYRFLFTHSIFKTNNPNHTVTQKRKDIKSSHIFAQSVIPVIKNHIMPLIHGQPLPIENVFKPLGLN